MTPIYAQCASSHSSVICRQRRIAACRRVNELNIDDLIVLEQKDLDDFRTTYTSDEAIKGYTSGIFLYCAFNKVCRIVNSDALVQFHSFGKDLDVQLKQLHVQQKENGTLVLSMTVYRGQATFSRGEMEKVRMSQGSLQ